MCRSIATRSTRAFKLFLNGTRDHASRAPRRPKEVSKYLRFCSTKSNASNSSLNLLFLRDSTPPTNKKTKMSLQTPRILPAHLHAFHPSSSGPRSTHTVRLLGTVSALHGDTATITCGGNGDVTLILKPDSHLQMGKLVEVVGKVADLEGGQVCIE